MARIAGVDLPRDKRIEYALPYISNAWWKSAATAAADIVQACLCAVRTPKTMLVPVKARKKWPVLRSKFV